QAAVEYHPDAQCPIFLSCLERSFDGNANLIDFVQRLAGYCLTGDTREQAMFMLWGEGSNGKSTLFNALKEVWGDYALQTPAETLIAKQGSSIRNDIARLQPARLVITSEMERGEQFAEAVIKQMTGQDTITSRHLYREFFEYSPKFKICVAVNHKPIIRGRDIAIWRRIYTIPFTVLIPAAERDRDLPNKLRQEFPGILAWALRGCLEWQRHGLNPPREVVFATHRYRSEMEAISRFIADRCITGDAFSVNASQLYQAYGQWCGEEDADLLSQTKFGEEMTGRGFRKEKSGTYTYFGVGLLDRS